MEKESLLKMSEYICQQVKQPVSNLAIDVDKLHSILEKTKTVASVRVDWNINRNRHSVKITTPDESFAVTAAALNASDAAIEALYLYLQKMEEKRNGNTNKRTAG